jgi:hypothetical protein
VSKKRKSTFGLRLGQLADLFAVAAKDQAPTEAGRADEHLAQMLRRQLTEVMPGNSLLFPAASQISADHQCELTSLEGQSLLQVLFTSESSVTQLQVVKEAGKRLSATAVSEAERAVATTIYHAAIARCLVHHNKKITQHSYSKLEESFALLIEKNWMAHELVELFSKARRICQSKRSKK